MRANFLELLAPARDLATGMAAIDHGADAVYIGADRFGARKQAGNSVSDIARLARYAHFYRAKVFVAFNTMLYDHELEQAQRLVHELYDAGADALIVQDMALLEMNLPPIELHASTQTNNYDLQKVLFLQQAGFRRVVLARELSLEQVAHIRQHSQVEIEYFIHGALCVSLSGQCYLSHEQGGRSANRGECAQACRLPYNLTNAQGQTLMQGKHLLSLKDLNHSGRLADLARAGVQSFKIEGRLKDADYVKNAVAAYRKELDQVLNQGLGTRASSGRVDLGFVPDLQRAFSRSATAYFLEGRQPELASFDSPKATGKYLGRVRSLAKGHFELDSSEPIANGDGLCFFDNQGQLHGFRVDKAEGTRLIAQLPKAIEVGVAVYRNHDQAFTRQLDQSTNNRKIAIELSLHQHPDGLMLELRDEDGHSLQQILETTLEPAQNPEKAADNIRTQLCKTGGTPFVVRRFDNHLSAAYFLPAAQLNQLRREALLRLEELRHQSYTFARQQFEPTDHPYPVAELDYKANVANHLARRFYERHGVTHIDRAFELMKSHTGAHLMTTRYCLKFELKKCPVHQRHLGQAEKGSMFIENEIGRFRLDFDCKACHMHVVKL